MSGPASASSGAVVAQEGSSRPAAASPAAGSPAMTVGNNGRQAAGPSRRTGPGAPAADGQTHCEESPNHIVYRKVMHSSYLSICSLVPHNAI